MKNVSVVERRIELEVVELRSIPPRHPFAIAEAKPMSSNAGPWVKLRTNQDDGTAHCINLGTFQERDIDQAKPVHEISLEIEWWRVST